MKKPNITPGEWVWKEDISTVESTRDDEMICELDYMGSDEDERQANAKAISAVPDMINALMEVHHQINDKDNSYLQLNTQTIDKVVNALKKAGVEL